MNVFTKLIDFVSGGVGGKIVDAVASHFPPDMSEEQRENLKAAIKQASWRQEQVLLQIAQEEQEQFNTRIKEMEGTAADLKNMGFPGKIIIFMRGAQRPIWGYGVLWMDFMVFSGKWNLSQINEQFNQQVAGAGADIIPNMAVNLQDAFWIINLLVLGFLFGERAVKNVLPLMQARFGGSSNNQAQG